MGNCSSSEERAAQGSLVSVTRRLGRRTLPPPIDLRPPSAVPEMFFACVPTAQLGAPFSTVPSDVRDADTGFPLRFRVVGTLGRGAFGDVFKVRREIQLDSGRWTLLNDVVYALKVFLEDEPEENDGLTSFQRELEAARELIGDPEITGVIAPIVQQGNLVFEAENGAVTYRPYLLFELINPTVTLSQLTTILKTQGFGTVKNGIIRRVAQALQKLHEPDEDDDRPGIAHRDIHGGNILVVNDPDADAEALEFAWQEKFFETDELGNFLYPGAATIKDTFPDFITRALPPKQCVEPEAPVLLERYLFLRSIIYNETRQLAEELGKTFEEFERQIDETDESFLQFERDAVPFQIRIIDFGKALVMDTEDRPPLRTSDPVWWSPGPNTLTGPRVDVWQLSVLAFLMSYGRNALQPGIPEDIYQVVRRRSPDLESAGPSAATQRALLQHFVLDEGRDLEISDMITWPGQEFRDQTVDYFEMLDVFGANFTGSLALPPPFFWMSGPAFINNTTLNEIRAVASIDPEDRPTIAEVIEQAAKAEAGLI